MGIRIERLDPASQSALTLVGQLDQYLLDLYPVDSNHLDSVEELSKPHVHFLGAFDGTEALGCGAIKLMKAGYGEIKRIYVDDKARGRGVGIRLLEELERVALSEGYSLLKLETGVHQPEALRLFEKHGYVRVARFGEYPDDPLSVFMKKEVG